MKIGIDSYCYHRYFGEVYAGQKEPKNIWTLNDFFKHVKKNHKDVEAISLETCFITNREKKSIVEQIKNEPYEIVFAWGHPNGFMDIDAEIAIKEIREYIKLTREIGQTVMRIAASSIVYYFEPHQDQIEKAIQRIKRVIGFAEDNGVRLAIENHGDFHLNEFLKVLQLVNADNFGITFDTGNALRLSEDCIRSINQYGNRILLIHAKDVDLEDNSLKNGLPNLNCVPAGNGLVDFRKVFKAINTLGYDGMMLIEISRLHSLFEPLGETEVINRGIQYLKRLRGEMGE